MKHALMQPLIIPLQDVSMPVLSDAGVTLSVLRLDQVDETISGNKWFKLKYNLIQAGRENKTTVLSFGGCFSNHLHALAAAGQQLGFSTIGIVRGERPEPLNSTLQDMQDNGMTLHFVSRSEYRTKDTPNFLMKLKQQYGEFYLIPEGGGNERGVLGCEEIVKGLWQQESTLPDVICLACGTGATLAGIIRGVANRCQVKGFSALKGGEFLEKSVLDFLSKGECFEGGKRPKLTGNWQIETAYHMGGFAKVKPALVHFMDEFSSLSGIPLEPVYTGKLLYGIFDLIKKGNIPAGSRIIAVHTGGLQGLRGMEGILKKARLKT